MFHRIAEKCLETSNWHKGFAANRLPRAGAGGPPLLREDSSDSHQLRVERFSSPHYFQQRRGLDLILVQPDEHAKFAARDAFRGSCAESGG